MDNTNLLCQQDNLRAHQRKILSSFPETGLYKSQTKAQWDTFVKGLSKIFDNLNGPRTDVQKEISMDMMKDEDLYKEGLDLIGCKISDSIATIFQKFKKFKVGANYEEKSRVLKRKYKIEQGINQFEDSNSNLCLFILKGIEIKKGKEMLNEEKLEKIKGLLTSSQEKLVQVNKRLQELDFLLLNDSIFKKYSNISLLMSPYFEKWVSIDSQSGKDSLLRGQIFENKVKEYFLPIFTTILKEENLKFFFNIPWLNVPGEIDIIIMDQTKEKVFALVECKARIFDISYAGEQIGKERLKKGNNKIWIEKEIEVPENVEFFVISVVQSNDYILGFESKIKEKLSKLNLDLDKKWTEDEMYEILKPQFEHRYSPLEWFDKYAEGRLFLLNGKDL